MKQLLILGIALAVAAMPQPPSTARHVSSHTAPFTMRDDFERDSLGQWASYPPAQDVGYEPSLTPTTIDGARGGRSLMRVVRPTAAGRLRIGFIKHVPFIAQRDARLSFSYRLEAPGSAATIETGLAGGSGRLFVSRQTATTGSWADVALAGADFRTDASSLSEREDLQALYIVVSIAAASPDVTYRFLLDDVSLSASRRAAFTVVAPVVRQYDPWPDLVATVGYRAGSTIAVEVEAPTRMTRVESRIAPQGNEGDGRAKPLYDDGTHGDRKAGDGRWTNDSVLLLKADDHRGTWIARVGGNTADGAVVETAFRFMVHASPTPHPRLYFTRADRERLRERTRHPRFLKLWPLIEQRAKTGRESGSLADGGRAFEMLDREYLLPSLLGYFDVLNRARQRIADNAIVAYVNGDNVAAASARDALLDVAAWSRWAPPWFEAHGQHTYYPAGQLAAAVSLGYDLLYDQLSAEQRSAIRKALIDRSILPTWREYVLDNRVMAHTSNWIAHTVGGALIAAAAIEGDTTPEEQAALEPAVQGLLLKMESHIGASFLPDGSYGEGISYQEFDLETLGPMLHALERVFGVDYWSRTHVLQSLAYPLSTLATPTSESLDMGDTHPPAGHGIAGVVYRSKDPVMRWYASRFEARTIEDFIFFDDAVSPTPPPSPGSRFFSDKGNVVFRGGWGREDPLVLFRAGPTFNHNHADQGAFLFRAFGETLATEAGWSDYYKDPYYATFFTQAAGHNTVLVDGDPESQSIADTSQFKALAAYPKITDVVLSDTYDALTSDLTSVYKGRLSHYTRQLVFMKPHYLLVRDDIRTSGEPARFDWLLHVANRSGLTASGEKATYAGSQAALAVRSLMPGASFNIADGRLQYATFATRTPAPVPPLPGYLDLRSAKPAAANEFVVALVPGRTPESANSAADQFTTLGNETWKGIETSRGNVRDLVLFRVQSAAGAARFRDWNVDADIWSTVREGTTLVQVSGHRMTTMSEAGRLLVRTDRPVSFVARYRPDGVMISCTASDATALTLNVGGTPSTVELNGRILGASSVRTDAATKAVTVDLPAGRHHLRLVTSKGSPASAGKSR
jgi:Heparinase II/III-like protein